MKISVFFNLQLSYYLFLLSASSSPGPEEEWAPLWCPDLPQSLSYLYSEPRWRTVGPTPATSTTPTGRTSTSTWGAASMFMSCRVREIINRHINCFYTSLEIQFNSVWPYYLFTISTQIPSVFWQAFIKISLPHKHVNFWKFYISLSLLTACWCLGSSRQTCPG